MIKTYNYEDQFTDNDETGETILTLPPETLEENGWGEGDLLKFTVNEETQTLTIIKVGEQDNSQQD